MTKEKASMILSLHLMQCGAMMPIEWLQKNGEGSEFMQAYEMAMDALKNDPDDFCSTEKGRRTKMFFISKKQFENEVRSRVEKELCRIEENRCKADELREVHRRCERLENRLEKIESMHGIPSNIEAKTFVI